MPAIMTHGIPMRFWNHREDREETAYLSTRRSGEKGEFLAKLRADLGIINADLLRFARDLRLATVGVSDTMPVEQLREIAARQDEMLGHVHRAEQAQIFRAEELVRAALADCHGDEEAMRILDCLCDRQILQAARMMELGEEPKDFFDGRGTRSNAPGTGPAVGTSEGSSSLPATDAGI